MKYVTGIFTVIAILAYGYLIILFNRTELATKSTVIGFDVIMIMYALCIVLVIGVCFALLKAKLDIVLTVAIAILSLIPITSFSYLNLSGKVISYTKTNN